MQYLENKSNFNVGKNLRSLLEQTGITISGFSNATGISLNHARVIMNGKASITIKTAENIAALFSIEAGRLFLDEIIKLKEPMSIPAIVNFYQENVRNEKFFVQKALENSVTMILKNDLIPSPLFDTWVRAKEIIIYIGEDKKYSAYKAIFNSNGVSKALSRIYMNTDLLDRDDLRGNRRVFQYKRKL